MTGSSVHSKPMADAGDDVGRRARLRGLGDLADRPVLVLGVVLRDVDEGDRRQDADDAAEEVLPPGVRVRRVGEQPLRRDEEPGDGERGGRDVVAAVQGLHGVLVLARLDDEDADDRREEAERARDEREEHDADDAGRERHAPCSERGRERRAEDHRADVLGRGGLEEVGAAARAVADVVADEVRDDGRVARVVLRDAGLDLADEVRADVGRLRVDAAAELREERDERRAEAVADDQERDLVGRDLGEVA